MSIRLEDIKAKYPFIYEIKDNYYIMGHDTFAICNSDAAISRYKEYRNEINRIGREAVQQHIYNNPNEYSDLVYYFRKVMFHANIDVPFEECSLNRNNLREFLVTLNASERDILLHQLEDYVATFWYFNRMF